MADPITIAIATAIASKATEALSEPAKKAIAALVDKVRERFRGSPADEAALVAAQAVPDNADLVGNLATALDRAATADPAFAAEIRDLWHRAGSLVGQQAQVNATAETGGVVNSFQGQAGKVIQAGDIHGDIHL